MTTLKSQRVEVHGGLRIEMEDGTRGFIRFNGDSIRVQRYGEQPMDFPLNRAVVHYAVRTLLKVTHHRVMRVPGEYHPTRRDYLRIVVGNREEVFKSIKAFRQALRKDVLGRL